MDAALAGLLGTAIGAVAGLGGSFLTTERARSAERQAWRRTKVEETYTQCIGVLLTLLDLRTQIHLGPDGRPIAVLATEDQPRYLAAMVDARYWLSLVLIYATPHSLDELQVHEEALSNEVDIFLGSAERPESDPAKPAPQLDLQDVIRRTYDAVVHAARHDLGST